jgi:hypothetical protein
MVTPPPRPTWTLRDDIGGLARFGVLVVSKPTPAPHAAPPKTAPLQGVENAYELPIQPWPSCGKSHGPVRILARPGAAGAAQGSISAKRGRRGLREIVHSLQMMRADFRIFRPGGVGNILIYQ